MVPNQLKDILGGGAWGTNGCWYQQNHIFHEIVLKFHVCGKDIKERLRLLRHNLEWLICKATVDNHKAVNGSHKNSTIQFLKALSPL